MQTIKEMFLEAMGQEWPGFREGCAYNYRMFDWLEKLLAEKGDYVLVKPSGWVKDGSVFYVMPEEIILEQADHIPDATKKVEQPMIGSLTPDEFNSQFNKLGRVELSVPYGNEPTPEEVAIHKWPKVLALENTSVQRACNEYTDEAIKEHDRLVLAAAREEQQKVTLANIEMWRADIKQMIAAFRRELVEALRAAKNLAYNADALDLYNCLRYLADRLEGKK